MDVLLTNYNTSVFEKIIFPLQPVYGKRHLEKAFQSKTWKGYTIQILIGTIELIPFIGALIAILERSFAWLLLEKKGQTLFSKNVSSVKEATYHILTTPGFVADSEDDPSYNGMFKGEIQGSKRLRKTVADVTKLFPEAISLKALKEQREINLEQYLIIKIKRLAHALNLEGYFAVPGGKKINMEGFCEAFTIPMIVSSFLEYSKNAYYFSNKERKWIADKLNQTSTSDHAEPADIEANTFIMKDPDFVGPISFGSGFDWHSTATIFFGGKYLLYHNQGKGCDAPGIHVFRIDPSRLNEGIIWKLTKRQEISRSEQYGEKHFKEILGAEKIYYHKLPLQKVGNCTLVSMEAALLSTMAIRNILTFFGNENETLSQDIKEEDWKNAFQSIVPEFENWWKFDRKEVLLDALEEIQEWKEKKSDFSKHDLGETYEKLTHKLIPGYNEKKISWRNLCINYDKFDVIKSIILYKV